MPNKTSIEPVTVDFDGETYDVTVWTPDGQGYVVEAVSDEGSANDVAAKLRDVIDAWRYRQMLVTLPDHSQVGFMYGNVHLRRSPGSCWDVPLAESRTPHIDGSVYYGEW